MKIAVTSKGTELTSEVDPRFARARYFIVVDTESDVFQAIDNEQNVNAAHGAGPQAAQKIAEAEVEALLSGNVGPRAFAALNAAGIKVYIGAEGTVAEAAEQFKAGKLQAADDANVGGHGASR